MVWYDWLQPQVKQFRVNILQSNSIYVQVDFIFSEVCKYKVHKS